VFNFCVRTSLGGGILRSRRRRIWLCCRLLSFHFALIILPEHNKPIHHSACQRGEKATLFTSSNRTRPFDLFSLCILQKRGVLRSGFESGPNICEREIKVKNWPDGNQYFRTSPAR
jgi:hypothetical protein